MTKKPAQSVNKSARIREIKASNPTAMPTEIATMLAGENITASAQFVSTVLSNAKKNGGKVSKRGPKPGAKAAALRNEIDVTALVATKKFAESHGGVNRVREMIDALAKLTN